MIDILKATIQNNLRHEHYKRTVELYEDYKAHITGEGLDLKLKQYVKREDEAMLHQRKIITQHINPAVVSTMTSIYNKVPRSTAVYAGFSYADDNEEAREKELKAVLATFYDQQDVYEYLTYRYKQLVELDPNAFIVVEFEGTDGTERAKPYPFEVYSTEAVNYRLDNGKTKWLVVRNTFMVEVVIDGKKVRKEAEKYTGYDMNGAVIMMQVYDDKIPLQEDGQEVVYGDNVYVQLNGKMFMIITPTPYNLPWCPAFRVGYLYDTVTNGKTYINMFHASLCYLEKMIKVVSEMDITCANVAFPVRIQAVTRCNAQGCVDGNLPDGGKCKSCNGTGKLTPTTVQDVIYVNLTGDGEFQLSLDNVLRYVAPDVSILDFQKQYIQDLARDAKFAAFNSDTFSKAEVAETATAKNLDMQAVYDTLYTYALSLTRMYTNLVKTVAEITDLQTGLTVTTSVDKDFKLKSTEEMAEELKVLRESGAAPALVEAKEYDLMEKAFGGDNYEVKKYKTQAYFAPFAGKTAEQINLIVAALPNDNPVKVLWMFWGPIFDDLEMADAMFYFKEKSLQKAAIDAKVKEYAATLSVEEPEPRLGFNFEDAD